MSASSQRPTKSHVIAWVVAFFVGVPVLYFLSVPPIILTNSASPYAHHPLYHSETLKGYDRVYDGVRFNCAPMSEPLMDYWHWWARIINRLPPSP